MIIAICTFFPYQSSSIHLFIAGIVIMAGAIRAGRDVVHALKRLIERIGRFIAQRERYVVYVLIRGS